MYFKQLNFSQWLSPRFFQRSDVDIAIASVRPSVRHAWTKSNQRNTCIKWLIWPPLEPKTEGCFSSISSYWFIRRMVQVLNSGIYLKFNGCYGYKNGRQNRPKIEKMPFWAKIKAFSDQFDKN